MRLVVTAHWEKDPDLDAVAEAMGPLKAPGTVGLALSYNEGDEQAQKTYDAILEASERQV